MPIMLRFRAAIGRHRDENGDILEIFRGSARYYCPVCCLKMEMSRSFTEFEQDKNYENSITNVDN